MSCWENAHRKHNHMKMLIKYSIAHLSNLFNFSTPGPPYSLRLTLRHVNFQLQLGINRHGDMTERVEKGTKHRETLTKTEFKINSCGKYTTRTQVISNFQRKRTNNTSITNSKTVLKIQVHDKKPRCST